MTTHIRHVTRDGERWDALAMRYYGSIDEQRRLIEANRGLFPDHALPAVLSAGLVLAVPIVARAEVVAPHRLPPWKRT